MRPLRFLHLTTFYPPYSFGGDAMYIYRLSHALAKGGHQVDVVHCVDSYHLLHPARPEIEFAEHPNVVRHELRSKYEWLSPLLTQQTGRTYLKHKQIRDLLDRGRYDVVHYHNTSLLGPEVLTFEPKRGRVIKMYTAHDHWLVCPTHVLWKSGNRACEKPDCFRCTIKAKRPPQLWRYTNYLHNASEHVDQFVSPSNFSARMHAKRGFKQPIARLPYFTERMENGPGGSSPHDKPYFLFVGRLEKIKGLHTLIDLWNRVHNYDLLVAGTGEEGDALRAQAAGNPRIKFLGPLPQQELDRYYRHALSIIVPSLTYETFGIIIIEAYARRTPVIVRDLGALPEVVNESAGGFIYRDDDELLAAINKLGSSPELRKQFGNNGYDAFIARWSPEAHLKLYFDFLASAATRKFGGVPWETEEKAVEV
jgi:glycosyltransferase involved in cell wall biosynthesis